MKNKLISAWNSVKYGKNGWTNAGDMFRCHTVQTIACNACIHHQADQLCSGKASQRTHQCGFLVLPTTESLLLDLTTLNLAAQSGTRFAFVIQVVDNEASSNNALMKYYQRKNIRWKYVSFCVLLITSTCLPYWDQKSLIWKPTIGYNLLQPCRSLLLLRLTVALKPLRRTTGARWN